MSKKGVITFTASKTFEDAKEYLTFASSAHEFTEKYLIEWDNFKNSSLIQEIPPEVLLKNPHVKELVEALRIIAKREYPLADKVLQKWRDNEEPPNTIDSGDVS